MTPGIFEKQLYPQQAVYAQIKTTYRKRAILPIVKRTAIPDPKLLAHKAQKRTGAFV